jgi:hypothetical protein
MKLLVSSLLSLLICSSALANTVEFSFFDLKPLYREPFANLRSPDAGISLNTSRYKGQRIMYFEAAIGRNIPIVTSHIKPELFDDEILVQLGLSAGFWATLGYDDGAFPLLTEDFIISIPLEFKYGNWTGAIKFNHISAHLGDGFDKLLKGKLSTSDQKDLDDVEDIVGENVGIVLRKPVVYSRDFITLHAAYSYKIGKLNSRTYLHAGYAHKMMPEKLDRWFTGSGTEVVYPSKTLAPYYAQDVTWHGDTDSVDLSFEAGVIILSSETRYYTLRVGFTGYIGIDRRGQLVGNKLKQFGLGLFIY